MVQRYTRRSLFSNQGLRGESRKLCGLNHDKTLSFAKRGLICTKEKSLYEQ